MPAEIPHAGLISIHAPRKGERRKFYVRGFNRFSISIHAPRKGERLEGFCSCVSFFAISIHAPRKGERRGRHISTQKGGNFNPRSPQGGATIPCKNNRRHGRISIHAPHEGERHRP